MMLLYSSIFYLIKRNTIDVDKLQQLFKFLLLGASLYFISLLELVLIPESQTFLCGSPQIYNPLFGIYVAMSATLGILVCSIWGLRIKE